MKRVDFFTLQRPIQERFVASAKGQGAPAPLMIAPPRPAYAAILWGLASFALVISWAFAVSVGYGVLESPFALQPEWMLAVHAGLLMAATACGFRARAVLQKSTRLPFPPGIYLFPIGVIDAQASPFGVHTWDELKNMQFSSSGATLSFAGGRFDFKAKAGTPISEIERRLNEYRAQLTSGPREERDLVLFDPLMDNGYRNPFSPRESMMPPPRARLPVAALVGILVAGLCGAGSFFVRNSYGATALLTKARTANSVEGYKAYLARGGAETEVRDLLLPRAELRDAMEDKSVEAIERFIATHPNTQIKTEVDNALRIALLSALETAKAKKSLTALREFEKQHAKHQALIPELGIAKRNLLTQVLIDFRDQSKPDRELFDFVKRLIAYADAHGGKVVIRFHQLESRTLEKNEKMLAQSAYFGGSRTLPSRFLLGETVRKAEAKAGKALAEKLGALFPADLLSFSVGPPVEGAAEGPPKFSAPTLLIQYRIETSGAFVSKKPRAVFTGVGLIADSYFSLPDAGPAIETKHRAWHAPETRLIDAGELAPESAYDQMLDEAFQRFNEKYFEPWSKKTGR
jgi:hypothetical protein